MNTSLEIIGNSSSLKEEVTRIKTSRWYTFHSHFWYTLPVPSTICIITVKLSRKKQEYSLSIFISVFSTTERTLRLLDISILQSLIPIFEIRETADAFQSPAEIPTGMHSLLKSL